ncbi:hypothetical protein [Moorena producens]|uniref:hypothetical protein n=1 Tax=Moorena producens TaxID=1155739 RepID=UPI0009F41AC2|nr:hypothetical protein [Moorena producens]
MGYKSIVHITCKYSTVSGQRSVVSGQWSAVSRQPSAVSRQPSAYFIQKLGVAWPQAKACGHATRMAES